MIAALIFNIFAVFFAWLESAKLYKHGLKLSLFVVFLFLALRYDYGNDYMGYLEFFNYVKHLDSFNPDSFKIKGHELGWVYLNRWFGLLGFFVMTAVLAFFTCYVLYRFIRKYVPPPYYWFAVFFYVFQPYNMLVLSSAMRQAIAVLFFLIAIDYIIQKKVIKYLLLLFIATFFHTTAIFMIPLILLAFVNWRINFVYIIIIATLFVLPLIYNKEIYNSIDIFTRQYLEFYSGHLKEIEGSVQIGPGFALNIFIYLIVIYYSQFETNIGQSILFKITVISFLIIPFGFVVPLTGRLNFYLLPVLMAVFPFVFSKIKKLEIRISYMIIVLFLTLYNFFIFFLSDVWKDDFGVYHTIFSAQ